ncbi:MAG TPA: hypothetical protein GX747_01290 [Tenericutes bacterium]|nr:hypothetical protein [Mycoplasmatota bacterium]
MTLDVQFRLKSNANYIKYIRENSYWYKYLNRNPQLIKNFEDEVKEVYKLRSTDKIGRVLDTIEMVQNLMASLN